MAPTVRRQSVTNRGLLSCDVPCAVSLGHCSGRPPAPLWLIGQKPRAGFMIVGMFRHYRSGPAQCVSFRGRTQPGNSVRRNVASGGGESSRH
jgi:hypothetical protein